jgi:hypothetical protein
MSIAFSFIAWAIVTVRYVWPVLRLRSRAEALRPLLMLHSFRFVGLAFLVPGVGRLTCRLPSHNPPPMGTALLPHSLCWR